MLLAPLLTALVVAISSPADVSPTLVEHVVDEANAIWRPAGVTLVRRRDDDGASAPIAIVIGPERGSAHAYDAPLGWIQFNGTHPQPQLYLSYTNAIALLQSARGIVGLISQMPILERETYLGRAMGRALAHELGHYLLEAKTHTSTGLMKANFTAAEFFTSDHTRFTLTAAQQSTAAARVNEAALLASAATPTSGSASSTSRKPASTRPGTARWQGPTPH